MNADRVGIDALKRHGPLTFVPIFLIVNFTAGRLPVGTVEVAMNDSAEDVARYPTLLIDTTRSGKPESDGVLVAPLIWYTVLDLVPGALTDGVLTAVLVEGLVVVAPPKEMVVEAVGTTEREVFPEDLNI